MDSNMFDEIAVYDNNHDFRLVWEYIGEGHYGDYNSDDSTDEPLLRFSIEKRMNGLPFDWEQVEDASYCTLRNIYTESNELVNVGKMILDEFLECYNSGEGWKRRMELASCY